MKNGSKPINPILDLNQDKSGLIGLTKREYFTAKAMLAVMQETQEMKVKSFWDWIKFLLVTYLHFNFLTVRFVKVKDVYEDASKRAVEYADAILKQLES